MKLILVALVISLVSTAAFSGESVYVDSVTCVGGNFGLKLPMDARKIRSIGRLLREQVSEVEREDGYTASRKTLYFDGLEIGVVEFSNDPARLMVTHAEVTSSRWNSLAPFKIGQPIATSLAALGSIANGDKALAKTYGSENGSVQFHSSGGIIVGLSYSCYSG